ncbi:MAG: sulfatase-like hydrolase/transferase [Ilumatobacteraceae bacterium]
MTRKHFLTYLALSAVSVAQPVFDLYGKNLTVFSAAKLSSLEVGLFFVLLLLGPALVAAAVDVSTRRFGPRVNESTRLVLLALLSATLGLAVARLVKDDSDIVAVSFAAVFGIALPLGFDRFRAVREWSRWLALLALVVGATTFVQLRPLMFPGDGGGGDVSVGRKDVNVLLVVLDELPLYPLLGADGSINAERFPGFAALAASSTWYRNSLAASNFTHEAVPAVLASTEPVRSGGPFLFSYPRNIFTLYSGAMKVAGNEPVTALCPKKVCGGDGGFGTGLSPRRFGRFLRDVGVVYGQRVLPPLLRERLPVVDQGWGGFAAVREKFKEQLKNEIFSQQRALDDGVAALSASESPMIQVVHALMPHAPWRLTPDQRVAPLSREIGTQNPEDEDGTRDTYQAFLHQLVATDGAVLRAVNALRASGKWDDTMVVVTADHGISFLPTMPQRNTDFSETDQANDVFRVPTFVKYPGQKAGEVSDCRISNLDLLPTINDVLEARTSWNFAGRSLASGCPERPVWEVESATGERAVLDGGFEVSRGRSEYYGMLVASAGPARRIAAVGASADLIGLPLSAVDRSTVVSGWTLRQKDAFANIDGSAGSTVPATITGTMTLSAPAMEGTEGIVVVDGIAAGVLGELSGQEGTVNFTGIIDYSLLTAGSHTVEMFVRGADGTVTFVGPPS